MVTFGSIFGKSPFASLQQHLFQAMEAVQLLNGFFAVLPQRDAAQLAACRQQLEQIAVAADRIKNEIWTDLPGSIFTSVDWADVLELLEIQAHLITTVKAIVQLGEWRQMQLPATLWTDLIHFVQEGEKACLLVRDLADELGHLVACGFSRHARERFLPKIALLSQANDRTAESQARLSRHLFQAEDDMKPLDVVYCYEMMKGLGELMEDTKKISDRFQFMVARS